MLSVTCAFNPPMEMKVPYLSFRAKRGADLYPKTLLPRPDGGLGIMTRGICFFLAS